MVRDVTRIADDRGIMFQMPEVFPANSLQAARIALVAEEQGCIDSFTRLVFEAEFSERRDISDAAALSGIAGKLGLDAARDSDPAIKDRLRAQTERAAALGMFGAPTFVTDNGELFWGDDRLEQALKRASRAIPHPSTSV